MMNKNQARLFLIAMAIFALLGIYQLVTQDWRSAFMSFAMTILFFVFYQQKKE